MQLNDLFAAKRHCKFKIPLINLCASNICSQYCNICPVSNNIPIYLSRIFVPICLIPLTHLLRGSKKGYKKSDPEVEIDHLLFVDDLKIFADGENALKAQLKLKHDFSSDIGMQFGLDKCVVRQGIFQEREVLQNGKYQSG